MPAVNTLQNQFDGVPQAAGWVDAIVLTAGTNVAYTLPTKARLLNFSSTDDFYVNFNGNTAAVPSASVTDGSASALNPAMRAAAPGVSAIGLISPYNCIVTVEVFA